MDNPLPAGLPPRQVSQWEVGLRITDLGYTNNTTSDGTVLRSIKGAGLGVDAFALRYLKGGKFLRAALGFSTGGNVIRQVHAGTQVVDYSQSRISRLHTEVGFGYEFPRSTHRFWGRWRFRAGLLLSHHLRLHVERMDVSYTVDSTVSTITDYSRVSRTDGFNFSPLIFFQPEIQVTRRFYVGLEWRYGPSFLYQSTWHEDQYGAMDHLYHHISIRWNQLHWFPLLSVGYSLGKDVSLPAPDVPLQPVRQSGEWGFRAEKGQVGRQSTYDPLLLDRAMGIREVALEGYYLRFYKRARFFRISLGMASRWHEILVTRDTPLGFNYNNRDFTLQYITSSVSHGWAWAPFSSPVQFRGGVILAHRFLLKDVHYYDVQLVDTTANIVTADQMETRLEGTQELHLRLFGQVNFQVGKRLCLGVETQFGPGFKFGRGNYSVTREWSTNNITTTEYGFEHKVGYFEPLIKNLQPQSSLTLGWRF
jgi:hypothetical protein